jgi:hypothetical protein
MQVEVQSPLNFVIGLLQSEFWSRGDFWIFLILSVVGVVVSSYGLKYAVWAYREAQMAKNEAEQAKKAATLAGRTVKLQSVIIELGEVPRKLEALNPEVLFEDARNLFNEVSWRITRALTPFVDDAEFKVRIGALFLALEEGESALSGVKPSGGTDPSETPRAVYNALESNFSTIGKLVHALQGSFEKQIT